VKLLVLGAGRQGLACAYDLLRFSEAEVTLADRESVEPPPFLRGSGERLRFRTLDVRDTHALARAVEGARAVFNATPYFFNLAVSRAALAAGAHVCDLGGNTEIVLRQLELDAEARARGCSLLPDCGLAPGMVNILAAGGMRDLDRTLRVRILTGGLPQVPRPPLDYQVVYSLDGVLDYYTSEAIGLEDGEVVRLEALSRVERVSFPGLGELEAFVTAGGISTLPYTFRGRVREMTYKTLRFPGHAQKMRVLRELGLLGLEEVSVDGVRVKPRDVTKALLAPLLGAGKDLVAVRVDVEGERGGRPLVIRYELLDHYDESTGISAMERTTGFGLSISGLLQVEGKVLRGASTPDQAVDAGAYVAELARRDIRVRRSEFEPVPASSESSRDARGALPPSGRSRWRRLVAEARDQRTRGSERRCRRGHLDHVAHEEGCHPHRESAAEGHPQNHRELQHPPQQDDPAGGQHHPESAHGSRAGRQRTADQRRYQGEGQQVAARRPEQRRQPRLASGEERHAQQARQQVEGRRRRPPAASERGAREQHDRGLARDGDRSERERNAELCGCGSGTGEAEREAESEGGPAHGDRAAGGKSAGGHGARKVTPRSCTSSPRGGRAVASHVLACDLDGAVSTGSSATLEPSWQSSPWSDTPDRDVHPTFRSQGGGWCFDRQSSLVRNGASSSEGALDMRERLTTTVHPACRAASRKSLSTCDA
jgi:lysine 6-dehydrogenase